MTVARANFSQSAADRWSLDNPNDGYATVDDDGRINPRSFTQQLSQLKALPSAKAGIALLAKVRIQLSTSCADSHAARCGNIHVPGAQRGGTDANQAASASMSLFVRPDSSGSRPGPCVRLPLLII